MVEAEDAASIAGRAEELGEEWDGWSGEKGRAVFILRRNKRAVRLYRQISAWLKISSATSVRRSGHETQADWGRMSWAVGCANANTRRRVRAGRAYKNAEAKEEGVHRRVGDRLQETDEAPVTHEAPPPT